MALQSAGHFEVSGKGIQGVVDTAGLGGAPVISLQVDGESVPDASLSRTPFGLEVGGTVSSVPDLNTVEVRLVVPEVNVNDSPVTFSGFAVIVESRTSIGGPGLVEGVLHSYEIRPVVGAASAVTSIESADSGIAGSGSADADYTGLSR